DSQYEIQRMPRPPGLREPLTKSDLGNLKGCNQLLPCQRGELGPQRHILLAATGIPHYVVAYRLPLNVVVARVDKGLRPRRQLPYRQDALFDVFRVLVYQVGRIPLEVEDGICLPPAEGVRDRVQVAHGGANNIVATL